MVNRPISEDLKECALSLSNRGWDLKYICDALGVSRSSCYRWRKSLRNTESIVNLAILDAMALLNHAEEKWILQVSTNPCGRHHSYSDSEVLYVTVVVHFTQQLYTRRQGEASIKVA